MVSNIQLTLVISSPSSLSVYLGWQRC